LPVEHIDDVGTESRDHHLMLRMVVSSPAQTLTPALVRTGDMLYINDTEGPLLVVHLVHGIAHHELHLMFTRQNQTQYSIPRSRDGGW
jgi:hypothetical protein